MWILLGVALLIFVTGYFAKGAKDNDRNPLVWAVIGFASYVLPILLTVFIWGWLSVPISVICASLVFKFLERRAMER